jgi:hypothetical protein
MRLLKYFLAVPISNVWKAFKVFHTSSPSLVAASKMDGFFLPSFAESFAFVQNGVTA